MIKLDGFIANGLPLLDALGQMLDELFGSTPEAAAATVNVRHLPVPGVTAINRADMLITIDDGTEKKIPVFVACTEEQAQVIDAVMSVYVRRGRLPEPGEVLFCTSQTSIEELMLLLRRFVRAARYGRGDFIFCVADLHVLSYTQQCTLVEKLRATMNEFSTDDAATLLLVSGRPQQVALNQLSSQKVDLPPLHEKELRVACDHAFQSHIGTTECVASTINGGGKSHHILRHTAACQARGDPVLYARIPLRESSSPTTLVELLSQARTRTAAGSGSGFALHIHMDISHIIPASANTMLFELLLVGLLRDPSSCRMYHRAKADVFRLEIPNSPGNKTARCAYVRPSTHARRLPAHHPPPTLHNPPRPSVHLSHVF